MQSRVLACLWFSVLPWLACAQSNTAPANPVKHRPDLTGSVELADGKLANATVFIYTAGVKTGTSPFCPSCYADCKKSARTDSEGNFKIESLDPELIFRILVVGDGCQPKFINHVDPAAHPLAISLDRLQLAGITPDRLLRGHVTDTNGAPILGAEVESAFVHTREGGQGGAVEGIDPLAVTDAHGDFVITSQKPFVSLDLDAKARGFAKRNFVEVPGGEHTNQLQLTAGASITGRVAFHGKPLANVGVGVVSEERRMETFTGHYETATDSDGRFTIFNLPANVRYQLYGLMESIHTQGATKSVVVETGDDGSTKDSGDLEVGPAFRMAGRVVLADGKPVPPKTRLMIDREDAWDSMFSILGKDGEFDVVGVPHAEIGLNLNIPGYRPSRRNASLDRLNPFGLKGLVDRDVTNLVYLMERGERLESEYDAESMNARPRPLHGIEGGGPVEPLPPGWKISGRVTDAATGRPIRSFKVTPGHEQYSELQLRKSDQVEGTNGDYLVSVDKHFSSAVLKVEADSYLPELAHPLEEDRTNFDLTLRPGSGPTGNVLGTDGKPVAGVTVALLCAGVQQMGVRGDRIEAWRHKELVSTTFGDGYFMFAPELRMEAVAAASPDGFKMMSLSELATNSKVKLEPWASVKGTLMRPDAPGTNEDLDLHFGANVLSSSWMLNPNNHAITDEKGRFEFEHVPPGPMVLSYRVKMGGGGWQDLTLQEVMVAAGQTNEFRIDAPARMTNNMTMGVRRKPAAHRGPSVFGLVLLPNGQPASGAEVGLVVPNEYLSLGRVKLQTGADTSLKTVTDDTGHFTLPGVEGATGVVAIREEGYAKNTLAGNGKSLTVTLQSWGKISGVIHIGQRLGVNERISLQHRPIELPQYDFNDYSVRTDQEGRFTINYVPPGEQTVVRQIDMGDNSWTPGPPTIVDVKPGVLTQVAMGGTGREVVGKLVSDEALPPNDVKSLHVTLNYQPIKPPQNLGPDDYQKWWQSKDGIEARRRSKYYTPDVVSNGAFRFEDVEPGEYELSVNLRHRRHFNFGEQENITVLVGTNINVPTGPLNIPCDVGSVPFEVIHPLKIGDTAPNFVAKDSEGKPIQLSDYHGKYLLLTLLRPPGMAERDDDWPALKDACENYAGNDRVALLGLASGALADLKQFDHAHGLKWTPATVANQTAYFFDSAFVDSAWSTIGHTTYLIGPDGKILAKNLRGPKIKQSLQEALARR